MQGREEGPLFGGPRQGIGAERGPLMRLVSDWVHALIMKPNHQQQRRQQARSLLTARPV